MVRLLKMQASDYWSWPGEVCERVRDRPLSVFRQRTIAIGQHVFGVIERSHKETLDHH